MTLESAAWAGNEFLKAVAGPASAVVVSVYVISRMFGLLEYLIGKKSAETP